MGGSPDMPACNFACTSVLYSQVIKSSGECFHGIHGHSNVIYTQNFELIYFKNYNSIFLLHRKIEETFGFSRQTFIIVAAVSKFNFLI